MSSETTISISHDIKDWLKSLKVIEDESFDNLFKRLRNNGLKREDWIMSETIEFKNCINGEIIDTTKIKAPIWCAKCGLECETEAIIKDRKPYHYNCSGIEL